MQGGSGKSGYKKRPWDHSGMLACFFQGLPSFLLASMSRSMQICFLVARGSIISSTKPKEGKSIEFMEDWKLKKQSHKFCKLDTNKYSKLQKDLIITSDSVFPWKLTSSIITNNWKNWPIIWWNLLITYIN